MQLQFQYFHDYLVMQLQFSFLPELILHKYSVDGYAIRRFLFFRAARHPADSDGRPTAGAQVLARVVKVPWHPYHSAPALHCRVPSRSERCLLS